MDRGIITISENGAVTIPTAPVWMTQQEMCDAFNVFGCDIRRAVHAIYKNMELSEKETMRHARQDGRIYYDVYSLEMVIAIAFRLRTKECMAFRRFIMDKLYSAYRENPVHLFFRYPIPIHDARVRVKQAKRPFRKEQADGWAVILSPSACSIFCA